MTPQQHRPPTRVYVKVNSDFDSTGAVTPKAIIWSDGRARQLFFERTSTLFGSRLGRWWVEQPG